MNFGFDPDEDALRDAVRALLDDVCPPSVVRAAWDAAPGALDRGVWDHLVEMGAASIVVDEDVGGLGLDERALVRVLEEAGAAAVPLPVPESTLVGPTLLGPRSAGRLVATNLGGPHVPFAADADVLLLQSADGALHEVRPDAVRLHHVGSTDGARRLADVDWDPDPATLVTDDPAMIELAADRGRFGNAAVLVGLLQRILDMTVGYVEERRQFGVPVGSFQAVKHHLADAAMALAFARPAVHRASWSLAVADPDRHAHVALAKLLANEAAHVVTRTALQCHGAIGYTVEYDLHLYMKRAWALEATWGDTAALEVELAHELDVPA